MARSRKFSTALQLDPKDFEGSYKPESNSTFDRNYNPRLIPKFWNGVLPHTVDFSKFTIDCEGDIRTETDEAVKKKMEEIFANQ